MSTFTVNLSQGGRAGALDSTITAGVSAQRTVYIADAHGTNRKLNDGDTFTGSNFFKKYCSPAVSLEDAVLEVTSDDGSVFVDNETPSNFPYVYNLTIPTGTSYADNTAAGRLADILTDAGGAATFVQITTSTNACSCKLNGLSTAVITLSTSVIQTLDLNALSVTKMEFANSSGGNSVLQILVGVAIA